MKCKDCLKFDGCNKSGTVCVEFVDKDFCPTHYKYDVASEVPSVTCQTGMACSSCWKKAIKTEGLK